MPPSVPATAVLPTPLTRFIGRERELAALGPALASARLLTLTGAGGSGKTRLARELLERTARPDLQVWWVDLATVEEPGRVIAHVSQHLNAADRADLPPLDAISAALGDDDTVIVLDNCEHLVDACAGLAEALLVRRPALRIIATSREALGIPGEIAWLVPPLPEDEAQALFVERAAAVSPGFTITAGNAEAIATICRRLDGLPLAIELAAARVRVLSPNQIAERLGDALTLLSAGHRTSVPRHRTLRATIAWSHALLTAWEQRLLGRLAVFAGSFTLEAAEAICAGGEIDAEAVLDGIAALVDKSLVVLVEGEAGVRYRLLETVRQYAAGTATALAERDELRGRHARWYVTHAEALEPRLFGGAGDPALVEEIAVDSGNFRAAGDWAIECPERAEFAQRLGYALHWFWFARGRFTEGRRRITEALAATEGDPRVRGRALLASGHMALWQGDMAAVLPTMEAAAALLEVHGDLESVSYALNGLGAARLLAGDLEGAREALERAMQGISSDPDHILGAVVRYWRSQLALETGEHELADRLLAEAEAIGRRTGHLPAVGHPLLIRGRLARRQQRWRQALDHFVAALLALHQVGDRWGIAQALEGVAATAAAAGEAAAARQLLDTATALRERIASPHLPFEWEMLEETRERLKQQLGDNAGTGPEPGRPLDLDRAVRIAEQLAPATGSFPAAVRPRATSAAVPDLAVRALGPVEVRVRGTLVEPTAWGSARSRELLLHLLVHRTGVTKEQVGVAFWPEATSAQVRNTFHVTLHRLRRALGESSWIRVSGDRYRLDPGSTIAFDVDRFEQEVAAGLRLATRDDPAAAARLEGALALYQGDFAELEPVADWALEVRSRLQRQFTDAALALAAIHLLEHRPAEALQTCRRLLERDPLHEEGWRRLMTAHARMGERTQAMRLYHQLVDRLHDELGTAPDRHTAALFARLQAGEDA